MTDFNQFDEAYVFELVRAAYERGYRWGQENPDSHPFLNKAAYDYADKTLGPRPNWTECCNMSPEGCDCANPKHIHVTLP